MTDREWEGEGEWEWEGVCGNEKKGKGKGGGERWWTDVAGPSFLLCLCDDD